MFAWRISDNRFPIFDGQGAAQIGGRWNSLGLAVIYASSCYSCCLLEKLVHSNNGKIAKTQHWIKINIPSDVSLINSHDDLLPSWLEPESLSARNYGDKWLKNQTSCVLTVPSIVAYPHDYNILINPYHKDFSKITISSAQSVKWDERLLWHN